MRLSSGELAFSFFYRPFLHSLQLRDGSVHKGTVTSMETNEGFFPLHSEVAKVRLMKRQLESLQGMSRCINGRCRSLGGDMKEAYSLARASVAALMCGCAAFVAATG